MSSSLSLSSSPAVTVCESCGRRTTSGARKCQRCVAPGSVQWRKCDVETCSRRTPIFYTHCQMHYQQLQKDIDNAREAMVREDRRKSDHSQHSGPTRPYRSRSGTDKSRRQSPAPAPSRSEHDRRQTVAAAAAPRDNGPRIVKLNTSNPNPAPGSELHPPPPVTLQAAATTPSLPPPPPPSPVATPVPRLDTAKQSVATLTAAAPSAKRQRLVECSPPPPPKPSTALSSKRHIDPTVIWEYECGACRARNVVRREVRFLQTYVEVNPLSGCDGGDCDADDDGGEQQQQQQQQPPPLVTYCARFDDNDVDNDNDQKRRIIEHYPAPAAFTAATPSTKGATIFSQTESSAVAADEVDRELREILDCRDEIDCSDTHFEIAIPQDKPNARH